jgi:hypothetical protein
VQGVTDISQVNEGRISHDREASGESGSELSGNGIYEVGSGRDAQQGQQGQGEEAKEIDCCGEG